MKILLTGSSGYIGSSLQKFFGSKYEFIPFDLRGNTKRDVRDLAKVKQEVRGVDGVLHLAAISRPKWGFKDPHLCVSTNILGTLNVLEALRQINPRAWIILGSSREVFGNQNKFPVSEKAGRDPLNAYGVSKMAGEDLLRLYAKNYGLRCLTIRFCGVYTGAKDIKDRVIPRLIAQALKNEPLTIEGSGEKRFDYVYIDDALLGVSKAINFMRGKSGGFYNDITFAANNPVSLKDLAKLIILLSQSRSKIVFTSGRSYDQHGFSGSYVKAHRLLGWKPKVKLEKGLKIAIEGFR